MTGSYLHHNDYGPDHICDVYHNECVAHSGFELKTTDNSYHLSPQHLIKNQYFDSLCPYLLWLPIDNIKHTLAMTTQWLCNAYHIPFCKHFQSHFPVANVSHHNEPIATDTMLSNQPALGSNATTKQISIEHNSKYISIYRVATDCDLSHTLEEKIMN